MTSPGLFSKSLKRFLYSQRNTHILTLTSKPISVKSVEWPFVKTKKTHKLKKEQQKNMSFVSDYVCLFHIHQTDILFYLLQGPSEECMSWKQHCMGFCQPALEPICCCTSSSSLLLGRSKRLRYVLTSAPHPFSWTPLTWGLDTDGYQRARPKTWPRHMVAWQGSKVMSVKYDSKTSSDFADMQPEGQRREAFISVEPRSCTWNWAVACTKEKISCKIYLCLQDTDVAVLHTTKFSQEGKKKHIKFVYNQNA